MTLWVPDNRIVSVLTNAGAVGTATPGTAVTTGGSASTKGTPVLLLGPTLVEAYWITILATGYGNAATQSQGALDIMLGTNSAAETTIIPNLLMGQCGSIAANGNGPKRWDFPLYIPIGSYIWAQAAGARTSTNVNVSIWIRGNNGVPGYPVGTMVTTYGMGTVPDGTSITPDASGASITTWNQITASTTSDHIAFVPSFQTTGDSDFGLRQYMVAMATGAAAAENSMGPFYWFATDSGEFMGGPYNAFPIFLTVPSGSRLSMGVSNSGTNDASYNGVIHAVS